MDNEIYIDKVAKIVYLKTNKGTIPIGMNYNEDTQEFMSIENIPYYQTFIEYVIRARQSFDPIRKVYKYKELFPYQWSACLLVIDSVMNERGRSILPLFSRQCLRKGTKIIDLQGNITNIEDNEMAFETNKNAKIYRLIVKGGYELDLTIDHPLQAKDNIFYPLSEFKVGDKVRVLKEYKNIKYYNDAYEDERVEEDGEITYLSEIQSIEYIGTDSVWDMEVPEKEWFIANGVKVHNCGKSESLKVYVPYLTIFARRYIDFMHERFTSIIGSYKIDTVDKLRKEVLPFFKVAIKVHNDMYPDTELNANFDGENTKLINNSNRLEIALNMNGVHLPYSECFFITMGTSQDSLTSHLTCIDECGKVDNDLFDNSVAPFSNSTGGTKIFIGVPSTDPSSLLQQKHINRLDKSTGIVEYLYDWRMCYSLAKKVNPKQAEIMKNSCIKDMAQSGGHKSLTNRMNYYLEFINKQGTFLDDDTIAEHNMFCLLDNSLEDKEGFDTYRVAGIDISAMSTGDYFSIARGIAYQNHSGIYMSEVKRIDVLNKDRDILITPTYKIDRICDIFLSEQIDMCMIDSTSQQLHFVQMLKQTMNERGIRTLLVPLQYSAKTKQILFSNWEEGLYSGFTKFPLKNTSWETEKLYEEMKTLVKEDKNGTVSYQAYRSRKDTQSQFNTDDLCNSVAMLHYVLQYVDISIMNNEWYKDGANGEWRAEKFKVRELYNNNRLNNKLDSYEKMKVYLSRIP